MICDGQLVKNKFPILFIITQNEHFPSWVICHGRVWMDSQTCLHSGVGGAAFNKTADRWWESVFLSEFWHFVDAPSRFVLLFVDDPTLGVSHGFVNTHKKITVCRNRHGQLLICSTQSPISLSFVIQVERSVDWRLRKAYFQALLLFGVFYLEWLGLATSEFCPCAISECNPLITWEARHFSLLFFFLEQEFKKLLSHSWSKNKWEFLHLLPRRCCISFQLDTHALHIPTHIHVNAVIAEKDPQ